MCMDESYSDIILSSSTCPALEWNVVASLFFFRGRRLFSFGDGPPAKNIKGGSLYDDDDDDDDDDRMRMRRY